MKLQDFKVLLKTMIISFTKIYSFFSNILAAHSNSHLQKLKSYSKCTIKANKSMLPWLQYKQILKVQ